jgi:hypothetical protein
VAKPAKKFRENQYLVAFLSTLGKHSGDPGYLCCFDYYSAGSVEKIPEAIRALLETVPN